MGFDIDFSESAGFWTPPGWIRQDFPAMMMSIGVGVADNPRYRHDLSRRGPGNGVIFQYTLSGRGVFTWRDDTHCLPKGNAFLLEYPGPGTYCYPPGSGSWKFAYVSLCGAAVLDCARRIFAANGPGLKLDPECPALSLAAEFFRRVRSASRLTIQECSGFAYAFMMALYGELPGGAEFGQGHIPDGIFRALRHMEKHLAERSLSVADIAAAANLSPDYFGRIFARHMGCTPGEYLLDLRLRRASDLLAAGGKIKEVLQPCGFADASYFCRAFKKRFGNTPMARIRQL